ncbi:MAG: RNA methyltransferase [Lentisphaerae bacterium]|nr:RNA methyltransferase [Lentisphaerota bacterium]MCP4102047.1 RNA methyltransferase [Lentisphaerota bacterium]
MEFYCATSIYTLLKMMAMEKSLEQLSKKQLNLIKLLYTRHGRKKSGMCICEGLRCCEELFHAAPELVEFTVCCEGVVPDFITSDEVYVIPKHDFEKLTATVNSQGILAVTRRPEVSNDKPEDSFILALDKVGDPGNFGTIMRTARAAGLTELWFTSGSVDPYNDKVIRSAMAAQFSMNLRVFDSLDSLAEAARSNGYRHFFLTDPHEGQSLYTENPLYEKTVVIIGSEAHGVSDLAGAKRVTIPMPGNFESLNAAQAATIFIFEYVRRISS